MTMQTRLEEFKLAVMLLTRFPAGQLREPLPPMQDAAWAYPLAGLLVGLAGALAIMACLLLGLNPVIGAFLAAAATALATGAMHEDGLADTADGFGGGRTRERKLEIMRDSRIGTYGVLALVLATGLRASALAGAATLSQAAAVLVAVAIASRAPLPTIMATLPPARADGLGRSAGRPDAMRCAAAAFIGFLALLLVAPPVLAIFAAFAAALAAAGMAALSMRQIGGQTGDTLGATQIVCEICLLLALLG